MAQHDTVTDYAAALPDTQRAITDALLPIIEKALPGADALWHGHPVWSLGAKPGQSPVCYVKPHSSYVTLGFWRGQALTDPSGRLEPGTREMAQVRLRSPEDVDPALFTDWLSQARDLDG